MCGRRSPINLLLLLSLGMNLSLLIAPKHGMGDDKKSKSVTVPKDMRELCQRVAASREAIVAYQVEIVETQQFDRGSGLSEVTDKSTATYYFEFSRVEDHWVYAAKNPVSGRFAGDWRIVGKTDRKHFAANGGGSLFVYGNDIEIKPMYFDPMASGLSFCEQGVIEYTSFEDLLLIHSQISFEQPGRIIGSITRTDDDCFLVHERERGLQFVFDPHRGYWPTMFQIKEYHPSLAKVKKDRVEFTLNQRLTEVDDVFVPEEVTMFCLDDGNRGSEFRTYKFKWLSVNKVIPTGEESFQKLAAKFSCSILRKDK